MSAWDDFIARHGVEDVVPGIVTSLNDGFATVDLGGVEGRIGVDFLWVHSRGPCFPLIGSKVHCTVFAFDQETKRVALGDDLRHWAGWEGAEVRFPAGSRQRGIVESRFRIGLVVRLAHGV